MVGVHLRLMLRPNTSGALDGVIRALVTNLGFLVGRAFETIDELAERICLGGILKRLAQVSALKGF